MDPSEVLDLYRAAHDLLTGEQALTEYWFEHYKYPVDGAGFPLGYWIHNDDHDHALKIEGLPDFSMQGMVFMVDHGDGEPACYCYRCPTLLTLQEIRIDSPRAGLYRPICQECIDDIHG